MRPAAARLRLVALLLLLPVLVVACASAPKSEADRTKALIAFGTSIDAGGTMFLAVGNSYNSALDAKLITPEQYRKWAAFATPFKPAYDRSVVNWKLARTANNVTSMDQVKSQLGPLLTELAGFGLTITQILAAK
jgi:hypothetical protein